MGPMIDVNVYVSRWPTRRLPADETPVLARTLKSKGIVEAWVGSFDALLHKDMAGVNARLAAECASSSEVRMVPFGSINPMLPDWKEDLRRCVEVHKMPGIRLHPNYHGYTLADPVFAEVLGLATRHKLIVSLAALMEDERMMHPLLQVKPVDLTPLEEVVKKTPEARIVLLNALKSLRGEKLSRLLKAGPIVVEPAMLEGANGLESLLKTVPLEQVVFGSLAPLFYADSALFKLRESPLAQPQVRAIGWENARRWLPEA